MTADRRRPPRLATVRISSTCPNCGHERPAGHHNRDAGDLDPAAAAELGYCPVLAAARNAAAA